MDLRLVYLLKIHTFLLCCQQGSFGRVLSGPCPIYLAVLKGGQLVDCLERGLLAWNELPPLLFDIGGE